MFAKLRNERRHNSLVIAIQLSENFVMRDSRPCTPLSHCRKVLQVFKQFLKLAGRMTAVFSPAWFVTYWRLFCFMSVFALALQADRKVAERSN